MEKEFKYHIEDIAIFDAIASDPEIETIRSEDIESIDMTAAYFDTLEQDFRNQGIAYRIRHENERVTATIKWDVNVDSGFHVRKEFNLVINDERFAENPDIDIFKSSDVYDVLYRAAGDKRLVKTISMDYTRKQFKIDTGKSISCLSMDKGFINHIDGHAIPVQEIEIEWYYGDEEDFIKLADMIQKKYSLVADNTSKLQRAFE